MRLESKKFVGFLSSVDVDEEFVEDELWLNRVHVLMLHRQGLLEEGEAALILSALDKLEEGWRSEEFQLDPAHEDVHLNVEAFVTKVAGEAGKKLHLARSRNDQVVTDTRLCLRRKLLAVSDSLAELISTLLERAEEKAEAVMPGYTHLQRAQPITLGFWLSGYASCLLRDLERLQRAYDIANRCPLGSCALAGTSLPIDRRFVAELLGFEDLQLHALDAVGSRDFIAESLFALSCLAQDLSRLMEEIVLYSSQEFNFLKLPPELAGRSSIMPQKRNPDVAELIRGKAALAFSALLQHFNLLKSLPLSYMRDLQEDRALLWQCCNSMKRCVDAATSLLRGLDFNEETMREATNAPALMLTEVTNYLAKRVPFREAHQLLSSLWREGMSEEQLLEAVRKEFQLDEEEAEEIKKLLNAEEVVRRLRSEGSSSPKQVRRTIKLLRKGLQDLKSGFEERKRRVELAKQKTLELCEKFTRK